MAGDAEHLLNSRAWAKRLGIPLGTLNSRFDRARLPTMKNFLVGFRLYLMSELLADHKVSIAAAAYTVNFSTPQSFGRHIRGVMRITGTEFRKRLSPDATWERFSSLLIEPHRLIWQSFDPAPELAGHYLGKAAA